MKRKMNLKLINVEKTPKYKLRKLSVGVVSFLSGFSILLGGVNVNAQTMEKTVEVPSMIADREDGQVLSGGTAFYNVPTTGETVKPAIQPLGGWTNVNFAELPNNLGTAPASGQGSGQVIEYTNQEWEASTNYDTFGWKPIGGGKFGVSKNGLNGINKPPGNYQWLGGYQFWNPATDRMDLNNNNVIVLGNYSDINNYKGIERLVNVNGEREVAFRAVTSSFSTQTSGETIEVKIKNHKTQEVIATHIIQTSQAASVNRTVMLPEGVETLSIQLIPRYSDGTIKQMVQTNYQGRGIYKFNTFLKYFGLYRPSKMEDALPEEEKIQLFKNGEEKNYSFTVKALGEGVKGENGRAPIAPYLNNINEMKTGIELALDSAKTGTVVGRTEDKNFFIPNKNTFVGAGLTNATDQLNPGDSKKLAESYKVDLQNYKFLNPIEIDVTEYKLGYSTKWPSIYSNLIQNTYVNRYNTENNTPYHQDVVTSKDQTSYSNYTNLTKKSTGRKIIILMDKTALSTAVNAEKTKSLTASDYPEAMWNTYQEKLQRAEAILAENETKEYLADDTANKLSSMAGQSEIDDLATLLPKILVKAPTMNLEDSGDVKVTPADGTSKLVVNYNDGTNDISLEAVKELTSQPGTEPATYEWKIKKVTTADVENTEDPITLPTGVSIDGQSGAITILEANVKDNTQVSAKDYSASNEESKEATLTSKTEAAKYRLQASAVTYKTNATEEDKERLIKDAVSSTTSGVTIQTKTITGNIPSTYTGNVQNVTVQVTYSDGSTNTIDVPVTVEQTDAEKYEPVIGDAVSVNKDVATTEDTRNAILSNVTAPTTAPENIIKNKEIVGNVPNTVGPHQVDVKVTYQDGTFDTVKVNFNVTETDAQKDTLAATAVTYKTNATEEQRKKAIEDAVTSTTGLAIKSKEIKTTIPTTYNGGTEQNVTVEVTYNDGSKKTIEVPVTVEQTDAEKYSPTASVVNVNKDNATNPATVEEIKNAVTLAGNENKIVSKELKQAVTNTVGEQTIPVEVTFADGTKKTVNVTVNVTETDAQKYEPVVGTAVSVNKDNVSDEQTTNDILSKVTAPASAPADIIKTKEIVGNLPNTVGSHQVDVKVTYKDGTSETVKVDFNVTETEAQKDTLSATAVTYKTNATEEDKERLIKDAVSSTTSGVTIQTKTITGNIPSTYTGNVQNVTVQVTYSDGSTNTIEVPVTVEQTDAEKYNPTASVVNVNKDDATAPATVEEIKNAVTLAGNENKIVSKELKQAVTNTVGEQTIPVEVTFADGTKKTVNVTVNVTETDAQKYQPTITGGVSVNKDDVSKQETTTDILSKVTAPAGSPDGIITNKEIVGNLPTEVGEHKVQVKVTYADNTFDTVEVDFTVTETDAQKYEPVVGTAVSVNKDNVSDEQTTNDILSKVTAPDNAPADIIKTKEIVGNLPNTVGTHKVDVKVTYKDGTSDTVKVDFNVTETDAQKYQPTVTGNVSVNKTEADTQTTKDNILSKVEIPSDVPAQKVTKKEIVGTIPQTVGTHEVDVKVTYEDGTSDTVKVSFTVTETQAQADRLNIEPVTYKTNLPLVDKENAIKDAITKTDPNVTIATKTITGAVPRNYENGATKNVAVEVRYSDGSTVTINVPVVVEQVDAEKYEPVVGEAVSVNKDNVSDEQTRNDILSRITAPVGSPEGIITNKQIVGNIPNTVGSHKVNVQVIYKDGTSDTVQVDLIVTETDAQKDTLSETPVTYKTNATQEQRKKAIEDAVTSTTGLTITNKEIKTAIPTAYDGGTAQNVTVEVTYNDGSKKTIEVPVTVEQTDAEKYTPTVSTVSVSKNDVDLPKTVEDIKNAVSFAENEDKILSKEPQKEVTQTVGEQVIPVLVTFKDGTTKTVNVTVNVTETQAQLDKSVPSSVTYKTNTPQNVREQEIINAIPTTPGITIDRKIIMGEIPTKYTDGNPIQVPVELTYSDGSRRTVNVPVTVEQTDAEKYTPTVTGGVTVKEAVATTQETKDNILSKVEVANAPDGIITQKEIVGEVPTQVGEHRVNVKVTYKDGTSDTVVVVVTIKENESEVVKEPTISVTENNVVITPDASNPNIVEQQITLKDFDNTNIVLIANKNEAGKWSLNNNFPKVSIDPDTGVITIEKDLIQDNSQLSATSKSNTGVVSETVTKTIVNTPPAQEVEFTSSPVSYKENNTNKEALILDSITTQDANVVITNKEIVSVNGEAKNTAPDLASKTPYNVLVRVTYTEAGVSKTKDVLVNVSVEELDNVVDINLPQTDEEKVVVSNNTDLSSLSNEEKEAITNKVLTLNPNKNIKTVEVVDGGSKIEITFNDGSTKKIDTANWIRVKEAPQVETVVINAPNKVSVYNPFDLTNSEENEIVERIKEANPQITDWSFYSISISKDGRVQITTTKENVRLDLSKFTTKLVDFESKSVNIPTYLDPIKFDLDTMFVDNKIEIEVPNGSTPEAYVDEMIASPTNDFINKVIDVINKALERQGFSKENINVTYNNSTKKFDIEYLVAKEVSDSLNGTTKITFSTTVIPEYKVEMETSKEAYNVVENNVEDKKEDIKEDTKEEPKEEAKVSDVEKDVPETGDNSKVGIYTSMAILTLAAGIAVGAKKTQKRYR